MALTQAGLPAAFRKSAVQFGVAESDFLFLSHLGISTYEQFALRIPSNETFEDFMKDDVCPSAAYQDPDRGLIIFDRQPQVKWRDFRLTEDAASLRKLWMLSREMCRAEVEKLASGDDGNRVRVKLGSHVAMEEAAQVKGMPRPTSDAERPALRCLNLVAKSFLGPSASFEHLSWESYLTLEEEGRLVRAGLMPKTKGELILTKDSKEKVSLSERDKEDPLVEPVSDLETMRRRLEIRARALAMMEVAPYGSYRGLHDRYYGKLLAQVPEGMRQPTVQEVRRFDRALHQELLRWLSRDVGTLEAGLQYYLDDDGASLWRLLDPVIKSLPDQGVEKTLKGRKRKGEERDDEPGRSGEKTPLERKHQSGGVKLKQCLVCKKRHAPLCPLPENFRKNKRAETRAKKAEAKAKPAPEAERRP